MELFTDKVGYNQKYSNLFPKIYQAHNLPELKSIFVHQMQPFHRGGTTKGYVRQRCLEQMIADCHQLKKEHHEVTVLDAGCGLGALSVYMAVLGFHVIGLDISEQAINTCQQVANKFNMADKCRFVAASLGDTGLPDDSIDYVIGHGSLHHFIKYTNCPAELERIMKSGAKGFFADSFSENPLYHCFQNRQTMDRLGDVRLTKRKITAYFSQFEVDITPVDWFVMLDKLSIKLLPKNKIKWARKLSTFYFQLDRIIENKNRISLFLSGSVITAISNLKSKVTVPND